jgi:hypothetical protein
MPNKKKSAKTKNGQLRRKRAIADMAKVLKTQKKLELELKKVKKDFDDPFIHR